MEPNQNTAGMPGASAAGQNMAATPVQSATAAPVKGDASESLPKDNMMAAPTKEKKKSGSGMVIGLILCLLLAAGGIGFGVWMMMDGNTQKDALNQQISALKKQNNELQEKIDDLTEQLDKAVEDSDDDTDIQVAWPVKAGLFGRTLYILDNSDKFVTKNEDVQVLSIVSCDIPVGPDRSKATNLTCGVETTDGSGLFLYDGIDNVLEYYTAEEWYKNGQDIVNRHQYSTD